jgi:hypothetical protein
MRNEPKHISVAPESLRRKHESKNPPVGRLAMLTGLVIVMVVICFVIVSVMMAKFSSKRSEVTRPEGTIIARDTKPLETTVPPHLQMNPHGDLQTFRQREEVELNSYGWINRTAGVVRIPIEQAMDLIAEQGLPAPTNAAGRSDLELIRERSQQR